MISRKNFNSEQQSKHFHIPNKMSPFACVILPKGKCSLKFPIFIFFINLFLHSARALHITQVTFPEYVMFGQTITMVCEYTVGQSEYIDSIKWYKDNMEFYRIVPNTHIERDRVVTFARPGIKLEKEKSGVSIFFKYGWQHVAYILTYHN